MEIPHRRRHRDKSNVQLTSRTKSPRLVRRKKRPKGSSKTKNATTAKVVTLCLGLVLLFLGYNLFGQNGSTPAITNTILDGRIEPVTGKKPLQLRRKQQPQQEDVKGKTSTAELDAIRLRPAASADVVANALLELVRLPSNELRHIFEDEQERGDVGSQKKDPFHLSDLEKGKCPHVTSDGAAAATNDQNELTLDWLPPKLSLEASKAFQHRNDDANNQHHRPVAIWFEHLSKAGGTSICNLAESNMAESEVPYYNCMPSEPGKIDARVGQWTNEKLKNYIQEKKKHIVSNEWEPFPLNKLEMRPDDATDDDNRDDPLLIFLTTIRHPLNRLVSAWKFWGILHNDAENKPTLAQFLKRRENRARLNMQNPQGLGKFEGVGDDFAAMIGRPNFAIWKFSGGTMPLPASKNGMIPWNEIGNEWVDSFLTAVKTLCQFDLVLPMELLDTTHETKENKKGVGPLHDLLGWDHFEDSHVVPSGKILNNNAKESDLTSREYDELWDKNRMDMLIYYWSRAVYLTRIHCADHFEVEE